MNADENSNALPSNYAVFRRVIFKQQLFNQPRSLLAQSVGGAQQKPVLNRDDLRFTPLFCMWVRCTPL